MSLRFGKPCLHGMARAFVIASELHLVDGLMVSALPRSLLILLLCVYADAFRPDHSLVVDEVKDDSWKLIGHCRLVKTTEQYTSLLQCTHVAVAPGSSFPD